MKRAISISELYSKKRKLLEFEGEYLESFGRPQFNARWFIQAKPASGKTTGVSKLCKYLRRFGRVAYNSIEEGDSEALKQAFKRAGIKARDGIVILDNESIEDLDIRLSKHKAPNIVVIDTVQHWFIRKKQWVELIKNHPDVMFIAISHMKGNSPEGQLAEFIRQDASIKLRIEGFRIFVEGNRFGGGKHMDIWPEGAQKYHGIDNFLS